MFFCCMADNLGQLQLLLWAIDCNWKVDIHNILGFGTTGREKDIWNNNIRTSALTEKIQVKLKLCQDDRTCCKIVACSRKYLKFQVL